MFRCAITKKVTKPKEPCRKIVVETRPVTYTNYVPDPITGRLREVTSTGWEVVKEILVSPEGLLVLKREAEGEGAVH